MEEPADGLISIIILGKIVNDTKNTRKTFNIWGHPYKYLHMLEIFYCVVPSGQFCLFLAFILTTLWRGNGFTSRLYCKNLSQSFRRAINSLLWHPRIPLSALTHNKIPDTKLNLTILLTCFLLQMMDLEHILKKAFHLLALPSEVRLLLLYQPSHSVSMSFSFAF